MAQWSINLDKWAQLTSQKAFSVRRWYAYLLYSKIVQRTPVDTGRARGNWNVSTGAVDNSVDESLTTARFRSVKDLPKVSGDAPIFISNNLEYIRNLEYGLYGKNSKTGKTKNGFSVQAPQGMVGVTVAQANQVLEQAVNRVKR